MEDKSSEEEIIEMAKKDLNDMEKKKLYENKLKIFLLPKDEDDEKNAMVEAGLAQGPRSFTFALIFSKCTKKYVRKKMESRHNKYFKK